MPRETLPETVQQAASAAYEAMERATRDSGSSYVRVKDGSPDWITDAIHQAHGRMLPDDWTYSVAREAFEFIANNDSADEDSAAEFCDRVDIYSGQLAAWFSEYPEARSAIDEAVSELGAPEPASDIDKLIMLGQYVARGWIFAAILEACEGQVI